MSLRIKIILIWIEFAIVDNQGIDIIIPRSIAVVENNVNSRFVRLGKILINDENFGGNWTQDLSLLSLMLYQLRHV